MVLIVCEQSNARGRYIRRSYILWSSGQMIGKHQQRDLLIVSHSDAFDWAHMHFTVISSLYYTRVRFYNINVHV